MKEKSLKREILSMFLYVAILLSIAGLLRHFVVQRTLVDGHSMENTLKDKEQLLIDKITYRFKEPERFDIIVFPYKYDEDVYYIKRIIGLPGERVMIHGNTIYINGKPLSETYGKEAMDEDTAGVAETELLLGEDEYFVLGDNRNHSTDSRSDDVGLIKQEKIVGRAVFRIWPLGEFGTLSQKDR